MSVLVFLRLSIPFSRFTEGLGGSWVSIVLDTAFVPGKVAFLLSSLAAVSGQGSIRPARVVYRLGQELQCCPLL